MEKKRGKFLTIMIVLAALGVFQIIYTVVNLEQLMEQSGVVYPNWYATAMLVSAVIAAAYLAGLWMWKKWGAYLLAFQVVWGTGVNLAVTQGDLTTGQITTLVTAISAGLWFWAIYRKWELFE